MLYLDVLALGLKKIVIGSIWFQLCSVKQVIKWHLFLLGPFPRRLHDDAVLPVHCVVIAHVCSDLVRVSHRHALSRREKWKTIEGSSLIFCSSGYSSQSFRCFGISTICSDLKWTHWVTAATALLRASQARQSLTQHGILILFYFFVL